MKRILVPPAVMLALLAGLVPQSAPAQPNTTTEQSAESSSRTALHVNSGAVSAKNGRIAFQKVFFGGKNGHTVRIAIFTVNPDGTELRRVTDPPVGVETGRPDWSPDGRWIAYMRKNLQEPLRPRIYVIRVNRTHRTDLTQGHCRHRVCDGEEDPAWSPNGNQIAFVRVVGGTPSIFVMRRDGTHRRRVMTPPPVRYEDSAPAWSPDAERLVFARFDNNRDATALFTVRLDGTHVGRITPWRNGGYSTFPDWAPNGRWILFQMQPAADRFTHLYMVHPNGGGLTKIIGGRRFDWTWGGFAPGGKMIVAVRVPGEETENDVYVMNLDGTAVQPVTGSFWLGHEEAEGLPDWGPRR